MIQPREVWEAVQREGRLYVDPNKMENPDFLEAYDWLRSQMRRCLPDFQNHYPWWAWKYAPGRNRLHVPRKVCAERNEVKIELLLDRSQVLTFPFNAWLMVASKGYVGYSSGEYAIWEEQLLQAQVAESEWPIPEPYHSRLLESWERIIEIEKLEAGGEWFTGHRVVVFEELLLENIVSVMDYQRNRKIKMHNCG